MGVGKEDFKSMDVLDADDEPLYSQRLKRHMERDIVQFVPFRDFKNSPLQLAKKTLEEVPNQFLSFYEKKKITPKNLQVEQSRQIQRQLSRQVSLQRERRENEPPSFFEKLKAPYIAKAVEMGMDEREIKQFIETHGIPEIDPNFEILIERERFRNPLRS